MKLNRYLMWVVYAAAFAGMGIAMPSCPGQKAMQDQIDALQAKNSQNIAKLNAMDTQVKTLNHEMDQVKQILVQVNQAFMAQKQGLEQLETKVTDLDGKVAALSKPKAATRHATKKRAAPARKRH